MFVSGFVKDAAVVFHLKKAFLLINERSQRKKQFDERKQDWLVQKFGLRDLKGSLTRDIPFLLLYQEEDKRRRYS